MKNRIDILEQWVIANLNVKRMVAWLDDGNRQWMKHNKVEVNTKVLAEMELSRQKYIDERAKLEADHPWIVDTIKKMENGLV